MRLTGMGVPVIADAGTGRRLHAAGKIPNEGGWAEYAEVHALFLQMGEQPFKQLGIDKSMRSAFLKPARAACRISCSRMRIGFATASISI